MKNIKTLFLIIVLGISRCLGSPMGIELPPELSAAPDIELRSSGEVGGAAFKLKSGGKWKIAPDEINKLIPIAKWIIFDFKGQRPNHVLQVDRGRAIIFAHELTLRYKIYIPLEIMLKDGLVIKH